MVSIHPIQMAFDKLPQSIKNTAREYPEGRNILIKCLCGNAKRTELEVIDWLEDNNIEVKDLNKYIIRDNCRDK